MTLQHPPYALHKLDWRFLLRTQSHNSCDLIPFLTRNFRFVVDELLINFRSSEIGSFRETEVDKLKTKTESNAHIRNLYWHMQYFDWILEELTQVATNTTAAKKPKQPAKEAVLAIGKTAPTMQVQNQLEKVVTELALPRSLMGNISAHTTHTTGPQEYAKPMTYTAQHKVTPIPVGYSYRMRFLAKQIDTIRNKAETNCLPIAWVAFSKELITAVGMSAKHMTIPPVNNSQTRPTVVHVTQVRSSNIHCNWEAWQVFTYSAQWKRSWWR